MEGFFDFSMMKEISVHMGSGMTPHIRREQPKTTAPSKAERREHHVLLLLSPQHSPGLAGIWQNYRRCKGVRYFGVGQGPRLRFKFRILVVDLPICMTYASSFALETLYRVRF